MKKQEKKNLHSHNTHTLQHHLGHLLGTPNLGLKRDFQSLFPRHAFFALEHTHRLPCQRARGLNLHLRIDEAIAHALVLQHCYFSASKLVFAERQRGFKGVPHNANAHCAYNGRGHAKCLFHDLRASPGLREKIRSGDFELREARVRAVDGFVAAEFRVAEHAVGVRGVVGNVGAGHEQD